MSLEENISQLNEDAINQAKITNDLLANDALNTANLGVNDGDPPEKQKKLTVKPESIQKGLESSKRFRIEEATTMSTFGNAADLKRYQSFDSKVFGEIGYNTLTDINSQYNAKTGFSDEFSRQFEGMWELAEIGLKDTYAFGLFAEDDNAVDFMEVMNTYSNSRTYENDKGKPSSTAGAILGNSMLSFGYTLGIIEAIAAEEIQLAATVALTRGVSAPAAATRTASLFATAGKNLAKFGKATQAFGKAYTKTGDTINFFKAARNIGKSRVMASSARWSKEWLKGRSIQAFGKVGGAFRGMLPLSSTADFIRGYDKLSDVNKAGRVLLGAGALARDARKFYLAHSESKLEADINRNEILEKKISEWHAANPGKIMPSSVLEDIQQASADTYSGVYLSNFATIYTTNSIGLHTLIKPLGNIANRVARTGFKGITSRLVKDSGKLLFEASKTGLKNWAKNLTWAGTGRSTLTFLASSTGEGFQEYMQDVYQFAGKEYYDNRFLDLQDETARASGKLNLNNSGVLARANFYDSLYNNLGKGTFESFISGFLIGFAAGPVNVVTQAVTDYTVGNKNYIWTERGRNKYKNDLEKREEIAEILTAFYNESGGFVNELVKDNLSPSISSHEAMLKAVREGNFMETMDNKSDIFRYTMEQTLNYGLENEVIEHFAQVSGMTVEEMNQFAARTDITEENKQDFINDTNEHIERIKNYKKNFDERNNNPDFINPYTEARSKIEKITPENIQTVIDYNAWELMRSDYIFSRDAVYDFAQRVIKMKSKIKQDSNITDEEINTLVSEELLDKEILLLEQSIKENQEYTTKDNKLNQTEGNLKAKAKLSALKKIQKAYKTLNERAKLFSEGKVKKITKSEEEAYEVMFEGFNEYMNTIDNEIENVGTKTVNRNKFKYLWDIPILNQRAKKYKEHALSLLDPEYKNKQFEALKEQLNYLEKNKKQFISESIEALQNKEAGKKIVESLVAYNLIFSLKEIDDLILKGIMPSQIYNIKTNENATKEEYDLAVKLINDIYENLKGKKITAKRDIQIIQKKFEGDKRTTKQLLDQYGEVTNISELVEIIKNSPSTLELEKQLVEQLSQIKNLADAQIIITDNLDGPIEVTEEDGRKIIAVDVRFSGSDYLGGQTRFEALLVSAILNTHFNNLIETNEEFATAVTDYMNQTKQDAIDFLESENLLKDKDFTAEEWGESAPYLNDPALFLSEALHNKTVQQLLDSLEDTSEFEKLDILEGIRELVADQLGKIELNKTALENAVDLAMLSFSEEEISFEKKVKTENINTTKADSELTIAELGITQEEWDNLTPDEREDIKNCR